MPAYNIKGITVEIGGDTKNFNTALDELNRKVNSSATEIGKLNRLLKLDPSNTVLLTQKQELLTKEIAASKDKLAALTQAKEQCSKTMQNGTESEQAEYRKLCAEIEETKLRIDNVTDAYNKSNTAAQKSWPLWAIRCRKWATVYLPSARPLPLSLPPWQVLAVSA